MTAQYKADSGVLFFNYGKTYLLRMAVAIHSLREHYAGPICLAQFEGDPDAEATVKALAPFGVDFLFLTPDGGSTANFTYSTFKHRILAESPYRHSLLCDTDLLFLASPQPLLEALRTVDLVVTTKFVPPWRVFQRPDYFNACFEQALGPDRTAELTEKIQTREYVNIGVFGVRDPRSSAFMSDWTAAMEAFTPGNPHRKDAIDEYYISAVYPDYSHILMPPKWNFVDNPVNLPAEVKILHYIRDLHRGKMDAKGILWQSALTRFAGCDHIKAWAAFDPAVIDRENLQIRTEASRSPYKASLNSNPIFSPYRHRRERLISSLLVGTLPRGLFNLRKLTGNLGLRGTIRFLRQFFRGNNS